MLNLFSLASKTRLIYVFTLIASHSLQKDLWGLKGLHDMLVDHMEDILHMVLSLYFKGFGKYFTRQQIDLSQLFFNGATHRL